MSAFFKGVLIGGPSGPAGPDGNPIGTIISFMGTTVPKDYLICDGAEYSVSEYPDLAAFFRDQFGTVNYFGGDGITAFAVPDMRNLFLRGYHGEAEEALSGEIGQRQEATEHLYSYGSENYISWGQVSDWNPIYEDKIIGQGTQTYIRTSIDSSQKRIGKYTARPVNMAVLYCIKATPAEPVLEEYDTDDGWHVRKWSDGYVEMVYLGSATTPKWSYDAPVSWYVLTTGIELPLALKKRYLENAGISENSLNAGDIHLTCDGRLNNMAKTGRWVCTRMGDSSTAPPAGTTVSYWIEIKGRWK